MRSTEVDLDIGGMTCASCAARVEKKLNRLPGVTATVNYGTERAHVRLDSGALVRDAIATVEATGYTAIERSRAQDRERQASGELRSLGVRVLVCGVLSLPVVIVAMVPPFQFAGWQWCSLALALPVVFWGAWPFHRAAWVNARHRAATMDTLISLGVLSAFFWSVYEIGRAHV